MKISKKRKIKPKKDTPKQGVSLPTVAIIIGVMFAVNAILVIFLHKFFKKNNDHFSQQEHIINKITIEEDITPHPHDHFIPKNSIEAMEYIIALYSEEFSNDRFGNLQDTKRIWQKINIEVDFYGYDEPHNYLDENLAAIHMNYRCLCKGAGGSESDINDVVMSIFLITFSMYDSIRIYMESKILNDNDEDDDLYLYQIKTYINFTVLYEGIHGISRGLEKKILNSSQYKKTFDGKWNELPEIRTFFGDYIKVLESSVKNIYKETEITVFESNKKANHKQSNMKVLVVNDFAKLMDLTALTFYQSFFYMFNISKETMNSFLSSEIVANLKETLYTSAQEFEKHIETINRYCESIFKLEIVKIKNKLSTNYTNFVNCVDSLGKLVAR